VAARAARVLIAAMRPSVEGGSEHATPDGMRGLSLRSSGGITGAVCGLAVGVLLSLGALVARAPLEFGPFFASTLPFAVGGLLLDMLRARYPAAWRSTRPGRLWGSHAVKLVLYWVAAYPFAILGYFALIGVADRYVDGAASLAGFLVYQAFWGSAFGFGFLLLNRRITRALRGGGPRQ
jgi:hypothetical protein